MASENEIMMSVLERAASDVAFRQALKANPRKVLAAAGMQMSEGTTYQVVENTPDCVHIVLPPLAPEDELGGEVLETRATKTAALCYAGSGGAVTLMPVCSAS
jgi:hypothetical protein